MKDQRQFLRKALHCTVSIFDENQKSVGIMADYSDTGIMIASYQAITVNQTFHFSMIDLPGNSGTKRSGRIEVQSAWCDKINTTQFGTGFRLLKADDSAKQMFQSYDAAQQT